MQVSRDQRHVDLACDTRRRTREAGVPRSSFLFTLPSDLADLLFPQRIMSSGASRRKQNGFHPFSWKARHGPKWFVVRDSYILAVDDPASVRPPFPLRHLPLIPLRQTNIYDVFMVDSTFEIERPTRVYRQGLHLFSHSEETDADPIDPSKPDSNADLPPEERPRGKRGVADPLDPSTTSDPDQLRDVSNHTFYLKGSERKLRLMAKTERQQDQFIASIERMVSKTIWAGALVSRSGCGVGS